MTFLPPGPFPVDLMPDGRVRTRETFTWCGTRGDAVRIEAGTTSDGATRPRVTAALVDQWGKATRAFLVHDVLCEELRHHRKALTAWRHGFDVGPRPVAPAFDAVDTDGALRAILRELGTPAPLRWIYWTGVRWGALGSRYRWGGWWRTLPLLLVLTPLVAVVMAPAVAGALLSGLLLRLVGLLCWPFTGVRPRSLVRPRQRLQPGRPVTSPRTGPTGPLAPGPCGACRDGCPVIGGPCTVGQEEREHLDELTRRAERLADVLDDVARRERGVIMHPGHETWIRSESARGPRREVWITRVGRAAARQVSRGVRAVGRGIAAVLYALFDLL